MMNPKNIYAKQLADAIRIECIAKGFIDENDYTTITKEKAEEIIKYFKGTLKCFDKATMEKCFDKATMENLSKDQPLNEGNSFLIKTKKTGEFLIGYKVFNPIDIFHELGHAVLELEDMEVGDYRSCGDTNAGIFEIMASKFSRFFLMPTDIFAKKVVECTHNGKCNIDEVAKIFHVDYAQVVAYGRESSLWE